MFLVGSLSTILATASCTFYFIHPINIRGEYLKKTDKNNSPGSLTGEAGEVSIAVSTMVLTAT